MEYKVVRYNDTFFDKWDDFISNSDKGTFLHTRKFLSYHKNTFEDYSLIVLKKNKIISVFPINRVGQRLYSHNGITYGDILYLNRLRIDSKLEIFKTYLNFIKKEGFKELFIKEIPFIFHHIIDQSNQYLYDYFGFETIKTKPFFVLETKEYNINKNRRRNINKALEMNYVFKEDISDLKEFWKIVENNLKKRYNTKPVHSFEEIYLLSKQFPDNIRLFTVKNKNKILTGILTFVLNNSIHFQYPHSIADKESRNLIDLLTDNIYNLLKSNYKYISFGSSEEGNNQLNEGLTYWKESFGAKIITQKFYKFDMNNFDNRLNIFYD